MNLYAFVGAKPTIFADPMGTDSTPSANARGDDMGEDTKGKNDHIYSFIDLLRTILDRAAGDKIEELTIIIHGNEDGPAFRKRYNHHDYNYWNEDDTKAFGNSLKPLLEDDATIYLLSCNTGVSPIPQILADSSGATVVAPTGYVVGNRDDPSNSKVRRWTSRYGVVNAVGVCGRLMKFVPGGDRPTPLHGGSYEPDDTPTSDENKPKDPKPK